MTPRSFLTFLSAPILLISAVQCALVNVTVDDSDYRISYVCNAWKQAPCAAEGCHADPNPANAYQGTWHDTSATSDNICSATIAFEGSAIYVQVILAGDNHPPLSDLIADWYFFTDGQPDGSYSHPAPDIGGDGWGYGFIAHSNTGLTHGQHTFTIQAGRTGGPETLLLLDAFIYSVDNDASTGSQNPPPTTTTQGTMSASSQLPTSSQDTPSRSSGLTTSSQPSQNTNSTMSGLSAQTIQTSSSTSSSSGTLSAATDTVRTQASAPPSQTTIIIAAVIPSVVAVLAICVCVLVLKRRRRPMSTLSFSKESDIRHISPFPSTAQSYTSDTPFMPSYSNAPHSYSSPSDDRSRSSISAQTMEPTLPPYMYPASHVTESSRVTSTGSEIATLPPYTRRRSISEKGLAR